MYTCIFVPPLITFGYFKVYKGNRRRMRRLRSDNCCPPLCWHLSATDRECARTAVYEEVLHVSHFFASLAHSHIVFICA